MDSLIFDYILVKKRRKGKRHAKSLFQQVSCPTPFACGRIAAVSA